MVVMFVDKLLRCQKLWRFPCGFLVVDMLCHYLCILDEEEVMVVSMFCHYHYHCCILDNSLVT